MCCVSTRYAHIYVLQIRQIWDSIKTILGGWRGSNKTNLGQAKTFMGRMEGRGAASRRSRGGVPARLLTNAKSGQTLCARGLCAHGQRSAVSGQRSAGPRAGAGQRSAVSGAAGGGGPKKGGAEAEGGQRARGPREAEGGQRSEGPREAEGGQRSEGGSTQGEASEAARREAAAARAGSVATGHARRPTDRDAESSRAAARAHPERRARPRRLRHRAEGPTPPTEAPERRARPRRSYDFFGASPALGPAHR